MSGLVFSNPPILSEDLLSFAARYDDCFTRGSQRAYFAECLAHSLSKLLDTEAIRKLTEQLSKRPGGRNGFLRGISWDRELVRRRTLSIYGEVLDPHPPMAILCTLAQAKKGSSTPGVGLHDVWTAEGKRLPFFHGILTANLLLSYPDRYYVGDCELYLPRPWLSNKMRRNAEIPESMEWRPMGEVGLGMYRRAVECGLRFGLLAAGHEFGSDPELFTELEQLNQLYLIQLAPSICGWLEPKKEIYRKRAEEVHEEVNLRHPPYMLQEHGPASELSTIAPWSGYTPWKVRQIQKCTGSLTRYETRWMWVRLANNDGSPGPLVRVFAVRPTYARQRVELYAANACGAMSSKNLLKAVDVLQMQSRSMKREVDQIGRDAYQGRSYVGFQRHLALVGAARLYVPPVSSHPYALPPRPFAAVAAEIAEIEEASAAFAPGSDMYHRAAQKLSKLRHTPTYGPR